MHKFINYACILPCCIGGVIGIVRANDTVALPKEDAKKVGKIEVLNNPIFDESDPDAFFIHHWANSLHINTKKYVIHDRLTFNQNDTITQKDLDESQRLLRAEPYIRDAKVYINEKELQANTHLEGVPVVIEIWDSWSLLPTASFNSSGGDTRYSFGIKEDNLFGTGIRSDLKYQSDESRTGYKFAFEAPVSFIDHGIVATEFYDNSDGQAKRVYINKPFYSLNTETMYSIEFLDDNRIETQRQNGHDVNEYQHTVDYLNLQYGWLVNRYSDSLSRFITGFTQDKNEFANLDIQPNTELPQNRDFMYPWVAYEFIQDGFQVLNNVHLIRNNEDFNLGWHHYIQLGIETNDIGDNNPMGYHFKWQTTKGYRFDEHLWLLEMGATSTLGTTQKDTYQANTQAEYFYQINPKWIAYAKAWASMSNNTYLDLTKGIGDETGVRGYPNEYQQGDDQWLLTTEIRNYPNINLYQLAELGWAVFADVGQASGGSLADNNELSGPLASVGIGARIYSSRSSYGNVAHIDLSVPCSGGDSVNSWEWRFLVKRSF